MHHDELTAVEISTMPHIHGMRLINPAQFGPCTIGWCGQNSAVRSIGTQSEGHVALGSCGIAPLAPRHDRAIRRPSRRSTTARKASEPRGGITHNVVGDPSAWLRGFSCRRGASGRAPDRSVVPRRQGGDAAGTKCNVSLRLGSNRSNRGVLTTPTNRAWSKLGWINESHPVYVRHCADFYGS